MTINVKEPQTVFALANEAKNKAPRAWFGVNWARTLQNTHAFWEIEHNIPQQPIWLERIKDVRGDTLIPYGHRRTVSPTVTGEYEFLDLPTGNLEIYRPMNFAYDENANFGNNKVLFLLRDNLVYWLTEQQAIRYLQGETLQIAGTKKTLHRDHIQTEVPLFDFAEFSN